jgi:hypothetical protein
MIFSTFDDRNIHCARRLNLVVDVLCAWIRAATPVFGDKCFTKIAPATRSMGDIRKILRPIGTRLTERLWAVLFASANNRRTALRRLFNHHMAPNALAFITFDDHALFVDPRDQMIAFRLLSGHSWQRAEFEAAVTATEAVGALQPGKWFIDCGANIGTQTIYALRSPSSPNLTISICCDVTSRSTVSANEFTSSPLRPVDRVAARHWSATNTISVRTRLNRIGRIRRARR